MFLFLLNVNFHHAVSLQKGLSHLLLIRNNGEIIRILHLSQKKTISSTLIKLRFQESMSQL